MRSSLGLRGWCLLVVTSVVALASGGPVAADGPQQGVAFESPGPFALDGSKVKALNVEVFNGRASESTLRLAATGEANPHLTVEPGEWRAAAGEVVTFRVTVKDPPKEQVAGELRATSSDGTRAVAEVAVGKAAEDGGDEATAGYPKTLDFGTIETGDTASIDVTSLPGSATEEIQVGHLSAEGEAVPVARTDDQITVAALTTPGSYSGTVDLTPGAEGGDIELTADARDHVRDAVLLLIIGLIVAVGLELFLRRWRPELVLKRRLRELCRVVELRQQDAATDVQRLQPLPDPPTWSVPRIYKQAIPDSFLRARGHQITESLKNAASDAQRDRWGPDGDEIKELEKELETYDKLLDSLIALAGDWAAFVRAAEEDREHVETSPLRELVDARLEDRLIAPGRLDRETKAAEAVTGTLTEVAGLYERFQRLELDARDEGDQETAKDAAEARVSLINRVTDAEDAEVLDKRADQLAATLYGPEPETDEGPVEEPGRAGVASDEQARRHLARSRPPRLHMTPPDDAPAPALTALERQGGVEGWVRRNLSAGDVIFTLVTLVIVVLSGLSLLYYTDEAWGSTGDEIAALVWGSTATAGLTLARRLVPGTFKTLSG